MSLRYLIDTNIISEPLRPKPNRGVVRNLRRYEEQIAIPSIVWHMNSGSEWSDFRLHDARDAIERCTAWD